MTWNQSLYQYHRRRGGIYLPGRDNEAQLALTHREQPLVVDQEVERGRYGPYYHVRSRIPLTLAKPYQLAIGAEKKLMGGVNSLLKAVPGMSEDYGCPQVTQKRLVHTDNKPFTKLVLSSLELRNALLSCPRDKLELAPGPEEGQYVIIVTTASAGLTSSAQEDAHDGWSLEGGLTGFFISEEETARQLRQVEEEFFPRMDRFLDLIRAAYNALTQWPM